MRLAIPQLSAKVGTPTVEGTRLQPPLVIRSMASGGQDSEGAWVSVTVTFWVQVVTLPEASVIVQVKVVTPTGYVPLALASLVL